MSWQIEFTKSAAKEMKALDKPTQTKIKIEIQKKLMVNPDHYLIPLIGDLSGFFKFRVGDYRVLCKKDKSRLIITVVKIKHRREVYD